MRTMIRVVSVMLLVVLAACGKDAPTAVLPRENDVCFSNRPTPAPVVRTTDTDTRATYVVSWCDGSNRARTRELVVDRTVYGVVSGRSEETVMEDYRSCELGNNYTDDNNPCIRTLPVGVRVVR